MYIRAKRPNASPIDIQNLAKMIQNTVQSLQEGAKIGILRVENTGMPDVLNTGLPE